MTPIELAKAVFRDIPEPLRDGIEAMMVSMRDDAVPDWKILMAPPMPQVPASGPAVLKYSQLYPELDWSDVTNGGHKRVRYSRRQLEE